MATKRKKSVKDVIGQFNRIWRQGVENSDTYKNSAETDGVVRFQQADLALRDGRNLSEKDKRINARIDQANRTAMRYRDNILRGSGFSDSTPFLERDSKRLTAYNEYTKKKFGYARRAGTSG